MLHTLALAAVDGGSWLLSLAAYCISPIIVTYYLHRRLENS